jgi:lipopolysaccharide export system permease protein
VIFELTGYGFERTDENLFKNRARMLNLSQLSVMSDSLSRERDTHGLAQVRNFFRSSHFSHPADFDKSNSPYKVHADSIIKKLNAEQRLAAADKALERAKQAQGSLSTQIDDLRRSNRELNMHNVEWHLKFTYPFACVIFFFIGAPLGAIIRKGGFGTPFIISLAVFLTYYIISEAFKRLANDGSWDAAIAIWMSTLVTLPMGLFFTYKATTDQRFTLPKWYAKASEWVGNFLSKQ